MAVIDRVLIGEGLVIEDRPEGGLDLKNVAHIDLILGPRGSAAEDAFCRTLTDQKQGVNGLLAIAAPNMMVKPNTVMFNKVTIKDGRQATQMFGPAQRGVAMAVMDCVADGTIPLEEADDVFICVGVFIDSKADMDDRIQDWNYRATKMALKAAIAREPKAADVVKQYKEALHPFAAQTPEAQNRRADDQAAALAITQMQERSKYARTSAEARAREEKQVELAIDQMKDRINTTKA